jgi:hypothetical protein
LQRHRRPARAGVQGEVKDQHRNRRQQSVAVDRVPVKTVIDPGEIVVRDGEQVAAGDFGIADPRSEDRKGDAVLCEATGVVRVVGGAALLTQRERKARVEGAHAQNLSSVQGDVRRRHHAVS